MLRLGWVVAGLLFSSMGWADMACSSGSLQQQHRCAQQALQHEDQLLQQNLELLAQQHPEQAEALKQQQQAWLQQRGRECRSAGEGKYAGPMAAYMQTVCQSGMSKRRNDELEALLGGAVADDTKIVWLGGAIHASFSCQQPLKARIGLQPAYQPTSTEIYARLEIGQDSINFPIGGQRPDALCDKNLSLELLSDHRPCPALHIRSGSCEAMLIYWDAAQQTYLWRRN